MAVWSSELCEESFGEVETCVALQNHSEKRKSTRPSCVTLKKSEKTNLFSWRAGVREDDSGVGGRRCGVGVGAQWPPQRPPPRRGAAEAS